MQTFVVAILGISTC